jgi:hypothetical protein
MGWPPWASIECIDRMLVFMGPMSLVACHQQMLSFSPTASMVGSGEKLGTDLRIDQSTCCGLCREPLFLRSSDPAQLCWWLCERLLCIDHMRYVWFGTLRELSVGCMWHVGQVSPSRVYIDSNRRDSRIWVPFICGSHRVVTHELNLINVIVIVML